MVTVTMWVNALDRYARKIFQGTPLEKKEDQQLE